MAKSVHNDVLDAALNHVKNNATRFVICSDHPTTFTEAMTTYNLATKTISSSDIFVGDGESVIVSPRDVLHVHARSALCLHGRDLLIVRARHPVVLTRARHILPVTTR